MLKRLISGRYGALLAGYVLILGVTSAVFSWQIDEIARNSIPLAPPSQIHLVWIVFALVAGLETLLLAFLISQRRADLALIEIRLRSSDSLQAMFRASILGMVRTDLAGRYLDANPAFLQMVGYDLDSLRGMTFWDLTPSAYHGLEQDTMDVLKATGRYAAYEKEYRHQDGHTIPVRLHGILVDDGERPPYIWSVIENTTEMHAADATRRLAACVFENTAEAILITDATGLIQSVNPAFTEITGFAADEVVGQTPRVLKSDHNAAEFYRGMWRSLLESGRWQGQIWNRRKTGEAFLAWQTITAVKDDDGALSRFVSVFNDMTEIRRKDEQIRHQAFHDALTGLPNRLLLQDRLEHAMEIAFRNASRLAVMFIDLDRFKVINDSLGHDVGDLLLIEVAARMTACLRRSDTIARLGGDEFVVLISDVESPDQITDISEKLIARLMEPMMLKDAEVQTGASIGIALYPRDGGDMTTLMKNADVAMYRAKASGRNTYRFFDPDTDGRAALRLSLENDLRRALERGEFQLYYQPKIDLNSGGLSGAEALIRWHSHERGLVPPDQFIPLAEETGLIMKIGDWVVGEACRQIAEWRDRGLPPIRVAVNVSARQFLDGDFASRLADRLRQHDVPPSSLEVELTESAVMSNPEQAVEQIRLLQAIGVEISIDDFGTGYSSLSHLKRLPLNAIKVDRSFVRGVHIDPDNSAIVAAVLALAEALGKNTVAEGVETSEEENHLRSIGCPVAQGYRYSRPLPAKDFERWLDGAAGLVSPAEAQ